MEFQVGGHQGIQRKSKQQQGGYEPPETEFLNKNLSPTFHSIETPHNET